ncbi:hypothetical protein LCE91_004083 [Salmonella enterica]|nr:hypothetical protein [Salmonella enterica subsp. enterica serovar Sandiego]EDN2736329.1 hypothetical protein [Salmonella enterica]EGS7784078.1 hypothetical protein [Salmonella enterica]EHB2570027.1 hypothetical protein [Salmonella enterica]EHS0971338.1 hypothetical protein [Salmonella enterica]
MKHTKKVIGNTMFNAPDCWSSAEASNHNVSWSNIMACSHDNPQHFIERAREQAARAAEVRGVFGSYEAIYDKLTVPEQLLEDALGWLYNDSYGWTEEEKRQGRIEGKRVIEVMELREKKCFEIITDVLPAPFTLSDVVREFQYWEWVYRMRDAAKKEIAPNELSGDGGLVSDRESWLDKQLEIIRPVSRDEALNVLRWYLRSERHQGFMDADSDAVYLNLIGAHNAE